MSTGVAGMRNGHRLAGHSCCSGRGHRHGLAVPTGWERPLGHALVADLGRVSPTLQAWFSPAGSGMVKRWPLAQRLSLPPRQKVIWAQPLEKAGSPACPSGLSVGTTSVGPRMAQRTPPAPAASQPELCARALLTAGH